MIWVLRFKYGYSALSGDRINDKWTQHRTLRVIQIPLPPLEVQREIVAEIEGYQRVIDGARAVIDNYRPQIVVDPEWPMVKVGLLAEIVRGSSPRPKDDPDYYGGPVPHGCRYYTRWDVFFRLIH